MTTTGASGPEEPVLVVGASRILAPAAVALARHGCQVWAVARHRPGLAQVAAAAGPRCLTLALDATTEAGCRSIERRLGDTRLRAALLYAPAASEALIAELCRRAPGRVLVLLTSAAAAPGPSSTGGPGSTGAWSPEQLPPAPGLRRLVLGWRRDGSWHSPEEISAAALRHLGGLALTPSESSAPDAVLGVVRPWPRVNDRA